MDITLIILAVLQLCVSITVAVLCTKDLPRTTREVRRYFCFLGKNLVAILGQTLSVAIVVILVETRGQIAVCYLLLVICWITESLLP